MAQSALVCVAVVVLMMPGCVSMQDDPTQAVPTVQFMVLGPDGLSPAQAIQGVTWSPEGVAWDVMDGLGNDRLRFLIFVMASTGDVRYEEKRDLYVPEPTPNAPAEYQTDSGYCSVHANRARPDVEFYTRRASGEDVSAPSDAGEYGWNLDSGTGGGRVTGSVGDTFPLQKGDAWASLAGFSGTPVERLLEEGSSWTVRLHGSIAQVIELPAPPLVCGFGFSQLDGTTILVPETHVGGTRTHLMQYGAAFDFCPGLDPLAPTPTNAGSVLFDGQEVPLSPALHQQLRTDNAGPVSLTVDQWTGRPFWMMTGFHAPLTPDAVC